MWKILTAQMWEDIYNSLISPGLFTEERKRCLKGNRRAKDLLYIDKYILEDSLTKQKNPAMS